MYKMEDETLWILEFCGMGIDWIVVVSYCSDVMSGWISG